MKLDGSRHKSSASTNLFVFKQPGRQKGDSAPWAHIDGSIAAQHCGASVEK